MKSGIIKKTTSYIMGIPMNDADIDTPDLIYNRIKASDEFELKDTGFDNRNMCPMVTVGYKDMEFVVDLKIYAAFTAHSSQKCHCSGLAPADGIFHLTDDLHGGKGTLIPKKIHNIPFRISKFDHDFLHVYLSQPTVIIGPWLTYVNLYFENSSNYVKKAVSSV